MLLSFLGYVLCRWKMFTLKYLKYIHMYNNKSNKIETIFIGYKQWLHLVSS